ncbi:TolC family protein [Halorhodospira halophila]|uniref:Outer membrane efflux protein n=1 Tax=Halorhodospira halophila (strain DSM 244 / SL1) TaxID=349124 RepID=A1WY77_HALHL|nr:TolC family protein [Halorhodospira halophila]ABM62639.1 outer membrane efflux protein [Halorhodospira halophila SL1]MBK1728319.1 TolC family protein [Halorhodospira halophila]
MRRCKPDWRGPLGSLLVGGVLVVLAGRAVAEADDTWGLSLEEAVYSAVEHNPALQAERLGPVVAGTFEQIELGAFDPEVFVEGDYRRRQLEQIGLETGQARDTDRTDVGLSVGIGQRLPIGADWRLSAVQDFDEDRASGQELHTSGLQLRLSQQLLQGRGREVNLVSLRQAELETLRSEHELQGFAQQLVADVEAAYWDFALADREIAIFEESLNLAEEEVQRAEERVRLGDLAETELAPLESEAALRRQELIDARSRREAARLELLRLIGSEDQLREDREIEPLTDPERLVVEPDPVAEHLALALERRPELNQARLDLRSENLQVTQTRNGLLPELELFIQLGSSGYADSFSGAPRDLDGSSYDAQVGISLGRSLTNRAPEAEHRQALTLRNQANLSLSNMARLVRHDVRTAHLELQRAAAQIEASGATRRAREEQVRAADERFRAGDATAFAVVQAQRDLLESRINEAAAQAEYRTALVELYRLDGTLLERRGIQSATDDVVPR